MLVKFTIDYGGVNFPLPYKIEHNVYVGFCSIFSGCKKAMRGNPCPDCQNPSLWHGLDWNGDIHGWIRDFVRKKYQRLVTINPNIEFFYCLLGGEPLDQDERELEIIHHHVMQGCGRDIPTVLFTGYDSWEESRYVKGYVNYIKLGSFLGNSYRKNNLPSGLATVNQRWQEINSV